jgi:hypothetical protein
MLQQTSTSEIWSAHVTGAPRAVHVASTLARGRPPRQQLVALGIAHAAGPVSGVTRARRGTARLRAPTGQPGDLLLAVVGGRPRFDHLPPTIVSGGGVQWTLQLQADSGLGELDAWAARAPAGDAGLTVTSKPIGRRSARQQVAVIRVGASG